jgi:hypothetical protein
MNLKTIALGLSFATSLFVGGCVVHEYDGPANDPKWDRQQHVSGGNYMIHAMTNNNLCFDVRGDKAATNQEVWIYGCHGKENQRFSFVDQPTNSSNITAVGGLCLDVSGAQASDGTPVNIFACGNDKPNQTFRYFEDGRIREVQTNKCLTVASVAQDARVVLSACQRGNQSQVWTLTQ